MKIRCVANSGKALSQQAIASGQLRTTEYSIRLGEVYVVYAMSLWRGSLNYLTFDMYHTVPFWFPAELFCVVEDSVPPSWSFGFRGYSDELPSALWGYKELINNPKHYEGLIEIEEVAVSEFRARSQEIDEMYSTGSRHQF